MDERKYTTSGENRSLEDTSGDDPSMLKDMQRTISQRAEESSRLDSQGTEPHSQLYEEYRWGER